MVFLKVFNKFKLRPAVYSALCNVSAAEHSNWFVFIKLYKWYQGQSILFYPVKSYLVTHMYKCTTAVF